MRCIAVLCVLAGTARADPCESSIIDPIATPLRETDDQRGACLRDTVSADLTTHALIDTPNFHGVLGGDLALAGRFAVREWFELGARFRAVDYTFVQTAVNKVTATRFGPLAIGAALAVPFDDHARLAVVAIAELPYTRDEMDTAHSSGQLVAAITGELSTRWLVHARFGAVGAFASSAGGDTYRFALRAGADLAWRWRARLTLHYGLETEGGWRDGFSTLLVRGGLGWRPGGGAHRVTLGIGAPLGGDEPTTVIVTLGVTRDL